MIPILVMLLVGSLAQFAAGLTSNNCCADMPSIISNLQAESDQQQAQLDSQQKEIDSLKAKIDKGGAAGDSKCERRIDGCYKLLMSRQMWAESKKMCEDLGGHLAFVDSQREHDAIVGIIQAQQTKDPNGAKVCKNGYGPLDEVWQIGARREGCKGQWTWRGPENKQTSVGYTNWYPGQPDCFAASQFCGHIGSGFAYKWDDIQCENHDWAYGCAVCEFA